MFNRYSRVAILGCGVAIVIANANLARAETPDRDSLVVRSEPLTSSEASGFLLEQVLRPAGRRLQGLAGSRLEFPRYPRIWRSNAPLRLITFLGGDRILAEVTKWQDDQIELRLRGGQTVAVQRSAIATVTVPPGEVERLYESFEHDPGSEVRTSPFLERPFIESKSLDRLHSASGRTSLNLGNLSESLVYRFPNLQENSRTQVWFWVDDTAVGRDADDPKVNRPVLRLAFEFQSGDVLSRWNLTATPSSISLSIPDQTRPSTVVGLSKGWHCLTLALFVDHVICAVDEVALISSGHSPGYLKALHFETSHGAWIDDLQVSTTKSINNEIAVHPSTQDDCVALHDGNQWLGRVTQVTPEHVVLAGPAGSRQAAWNQVDRIALRQPDRAVSKRSAISGLWAGLEFQSNLDRPNQPSDKIVAAITSVNKDFLVVSHPWMGEIAIAWKSIARIEPRFHGEVITFDARRLHLGHAIRVDFQRPIPDGIEWSAEFDLLENQLKDEVWLALDAVDLEPSGPGTPPASPFLKELRSGSLVTQLSVNDRPVGDLNRWSDVRSTRERPEHLRCRLPSEVLKSGRNTIRLRQIPLKESGTVFDNCELSNLRIELIERRHQR